jgi:hypothetical protein
VTDGFGHRLVRSHRRADRGLHGSDGGSEMNGEDEG